MKLRDLMNIANCEEVCVYDTEGNWWSSSDRPIPYRLREKKVVEVRVGDGWLTVEVNTTIKRHENLSTEKENITMEELIQMYTYYDRMSEYYEMKQLTTEVDVAKYHQFKKLRDALAREIEIQM